MAPEKGAKAHLLSAMADLTSPGTVSQADHLTRYPRVPTGVPGLDELIEGGFEKNSTVLLLGGPGTGKSTMALQFLYNGVVQYNQKGVFITFEETLGMITKHMARYGWDVQKLVDEKKLAIINFKPHEVKRFAEEGGGMIYDTIENSGAERLVIDSLTSYTLLFESLYEARESQLGLFDMLRKWNCTSVLTGEKFLHKNKSMLSDIEYLTDGVILLHNPRYKYVRIRALEILKMRGTAFLQKLCPYVFEDNVGVKVFPQEDVFETSLFQ